MKKKSLYLFFAIMLSVSIATIAFADSPEKMDLKVGDEIYACNCGEGCDCKTLSRLPGKCGCGNDLVKAKVVKIEDGMAWHICRPKDGKSREPSKQRGNMLVPAAQNVNAIQSVRNRESAAVERR